MPPSKLVRSVFDFDVMGCVSVVDFWFTQELGVTTKSPLKHRHVDVFIAPVVDYSLLYKYSNMI